MDTINFDACPKMLKVGHYFYNIKFVTTDEFNRHTKYGQVSDDTCLIYVRISNHSNALNTLLHEIMHAIHIYMDLNNSSSEEEYTLRTTNGLQAFWMDNPFFTAWYFNALQNLTPPEPEESDAKPEQIHWQEKHITEQPHNEESSKVHVEL